MDQNLSILDNRSTKSENFATFPERKKEKSELCCPPIHSYFRGDIIGLLFSQPLDLESEWVGQRTGHPDIRTPPIQEPALCNRLPLYLSHSIQQWPPDDQHSSWRRTHLSKNWNITHTHSTTYLDENLIQVKLKNTNDISSQIHLVELSDMYILSGTLL